MAEKTKQSSQFLALEAAPSDDKSGNAREAGQGIGRKHLRLATFIITVAFLLTAGLGGFLFWKMKSAEKSFSDYQVVNAKITKAEKSGPNEQSLKVIWSYAENTAVSTTTLKSYGSDNKYAEGETVPILYIPVAHDKNTPDPEKPRYVDGQYDQQNVITYLPWIIGSWTVAFLILIGGFITLRIMGKGVDRNETWG